MTTSHLISHRLFVAALNQEKTTGPGQAGSRDKFAAEPAAGTRSGEAQLSSGMVSSASQRSLLSEGVSAGLRFLRA